MTAIPFTNEEKESLMKFLDHVKGTSLEEEESGGSDGWCLTYWTYEVLEQLIHGDDIYSSSEIPFYLEKEAPTYRTYPWSLWYGKRKRIMFEELKKLKDSFENILICEVGFGVDIIICSFVKKWKEIKCYDHNGYLEEGILSFFKGVMEQNVVFIEEASYTFDFRSINKKTLVIANNTHLDPPVVGKALKENEYITVLHNGVILENIPVTPEECREIDSEINISRGVI